MPAAIGGADRTLADQRWETRPPFGLGEEWGGRVSLADGPGGGAKAGGWPRGDARGSVRRSVIRLFAAKDSQGAGYAGLPAGASRLPPGGRFRSAGRPASGEEERGASPRCSA